MVLVLIGIAIGILIVAILIIKATKTPARDIVGMDITCKKCGTRTNGLACLKCKNKFQSFGVWKIMNKLIEKQRITEDEYWIIPQMILKNEL